MGTMNLGAQEERQREFPEYRYTAVLEIKQTGKMEGPKGYLQENGCQYSLQYSLGIN